MAKNNSKLLYKTNCLSESKIINKEFVRINLFDKSDNRKIVSDIQKFITLNKKLFDFLDIKCITHNNGTALQFITSNYIGAIPIKMPYDGVYHKDFQVTPRFDNALGEDQYAELTKILDILEYAITPEFSNEGVLMLPYQLRPPMYYEAAKYISLFEKAQKYHWQKFEVVERKHNYPKSNVNWIKYSQYSADPMKALTFISRDNILSCNHKEWQELVYVFHIAKDIIMSNTAPLSLKYQYQNMVQILSKKISNIKPLETKFTNIHAIDPLCIKELKKQANIILQRNTNVCLPWRIDMATLFERYVQHIMNNIVRNLGGTMFANQKISGRGSIPNWGLRHLEPDITIRFDNKLIVADAKYKANFYFSENQEVLKETHRGDLHQILAYTSFEPQTEKIGLLIYPANENCCRKIDYDFHISGIKNRIFLCGIQFKADEIQNVEKFLKEQILYTKERIRS